MKKIIIGIVYVLHHCPILSSSTLDLWVVDGRCTNQEPKRKNLKTGTPSMEKTKIGCYADIECLCCHTLM